MIERYDGPYLYFPMPVRRGSSKKHAPMWRAAVQAVRALTERRGRPPTIRELARAMGWKSSAATTDALRRAERHGAVRRVPLVSRGIIPTRRSR